MPLSISNENKPTQSNAWSERALSWGQAGPANDTWAVPGSALTNETKTNLSISNTAKPSSNATWDQYTISYNASLPDTWDAQSEVLSNESKN